MLINSRLVTIDSSHWINLTKAARSASSAMREKAYAFPQRLLDRGYLLTLSWHHLEELLSIEDEAIAEARLAFIADLPHVAWVRSLDPAQALGSILDIAAAEVQAIAAGAATLSEVRDRAKATLIRHGSGLDALEPGLWVWRALRPEFIKRNHAVRRLTAIAPAKFTDGSATMASLLEGRMRSPEESRAMLAAMAKALGREISDRGDRRIQDPQEVADEFFEEVADMAPWRASSVWDFIVQTSAMRGLDADEIKRDMTIDEIGEICVFRSKLRTVAEKLDRPWDDFRRSIRMEQCPHWVIEDSLARHRQQELRREGGDLNDGYLAVLAAYVDHLYVDKRQAETFRRATSKVAALKPLIGGVRKAANYFDIPDQLDTD